MKTVRTKVCNAPGCLSRQTVQSRGIPPGWYSVMQADPHEDGNLIGHGIFCSTACVRSVMDARGDTILR